MRLKKNLLGCIAMAAVTAVLFAGCGEKQGNEPAEATHAATEESEQTPEAEVAEATEEAVTDSGDTDEADMSLKETYKELFDVGVAVNSWQLADKETLSRITKDYSTFTCENEMKPDYILDHNGSMEAEDGMPAINMENVDNILKMAEDAGLKVRAHTLVWHSQTPEWLFHKGYDEGKDYVDRDTMLERMESYIKSVMTWCKENHPGVIVAWDVVNECVGDDNKIRSDSNWYKVIGEDYIEKAFEYARKYAEEGSKLFINDYNTEIPEKRKMLVEVAKKVYEQGNLDGIGMQSHHDREYINAADVKTSLLTFSQFDGIEIQITELDLHYTDNSEEAMKEQAQKYKELFQMLKEVDEKGLANITNVTFWGLDDEHTWLTGFKGDKSYPLLYDGEGKAKPAYFEIIAAGKEDQ